MKNLILIPQWLTKSLETNGHSIKDCLNEEIVLSTLSSDDVGFYIFINQNNPMLKELSEGTFRTGSHVLGISPMQLSEHKPYVDGHVHTNTLNKFEPREVLFGALSSQKHNDVERIKFDVIEINEDTIGLVPSLSEEGERITTTKLKEDLLYVLDKYKSFKDLVKTGLFKKTIQDY